MRRVRPDPLDALLGLIGVVFVIAGACVAMWCFGALIGLFLSGLDWAREVLSNG